MERAKRTETERDEWGVQDSLWKMTPCMPGTRTMLYGARMSCEEVGKMIGGSRDTIAQEERRAFDKIAAGLFEHDFLVEVLRLHDMEFADD
jgi:hypothetical protein